MCHFMLTASIAGLCPMIWLAPAPSAGIVNPALLLSVPVMAVNPDAPPLITLPSDTGDWIWELMMDRLTLPLGPGSQNIGPLWMWSDQWFIAGCQVHCQGARGGQTRPSSSALLAAGNHTVAVVLAV
jgi:hypothetical protein